MNDVIENVRPKLPSLTGMRFLAAFLVFCFHAMFEMFFTDPAPQAGLQAVFLQGGWSGVGFFFVLSGFVLAWAARPGDTTSGFWRRRALKIYPVHAVTLVVAIAATVWIAGEAFDGGSAVLNLLLVQSFFPQYQIRTGFNAVAWSLSCELLFYLCFPVLHRLVSRIRPDRLWAWVGGTTAVIVAVPLAVVLLGPAQEQIPLIGVTLTEFWLTFHFPPSRLPEFVLGILLARIVLTGRALPVGPAGASVLALASYVVASLLPGPFAMAAITALPLGLVIAAATRVDVSASRSGSRSTWFSTRPMVWLGQVSFAFYMVHYLVLAYGHLLLGGGSFETPAAVGVIVGLGAVSLLAAWGLYVLVERPIMRRFAGSTAYPATPRTTADR